MKSKARTEPKNLLPNASFELDFGHPKHDWVRLNPGQGLSTNWTDMLTPLTMKLVATGQVAKMTPVEELPTIEEVSDAPDGSRAVAIPIPEGKSGHLTSPVVPLKPGQSYTLSVYARSDVPSAQLRLCVWTEPVDWRQECPWGYFAQPATGPNAYSEPLPLTNQWQRYELTFNIASYFHQGVVDLVAMAETEGNVWVDAAQLEEGPEATAFETRYPVEVDIDADKPFSGMLHLMGEPLEIDLASYTNRQQDEPGELKLSIETFDGKVVLAKDIPCPNEEGRSENKLALDFPLVGNFRARVFSAAEEEIEVSSYGYMFTVHPVMEEDFQGILYSREGKVYELPAERTRLPGNAGEGRCNFIITPDNMIYLMATDGETLMRTGDGGLTWDTVKVTRRVDSVLRDGSFLARDMENDHLALYRSWDEGQTWESLSTGPGPFAIPPSAGPITQLRDGTLVWPIGHTKPGVLHTTYVYRSTDGGKTWSKGYPVCPTGGPAIIELSSGRLLAVSRNNLKPRPDAWPVFLEDEYEDHWRLWNMQYGLCGLESVQKNLLLADSDDGGVTWTNVRVGTAGLGEMRGSAVELPDGRIVLMHVHRVPWLHGGERARVSRDGGNTWDKETYYLSTVLSYPEYSTNCVLPPELADGKPGMILSVLGDRPDAVGVDRPARLDAVRWRPLP